MPREIEILLTAATVRYRRSPQLWVARIFAEKLVEYQYRPIVSSENDPPEAA